MKTITKIAKWGNSLAFHIPKWVVDELDLKPGEKVDIKAVNGSLRISKIK